MDSVKKHQNRAQFSSALISGAVTAVFMYLVYYQGWESIAAGMFIGTTIYLAINFYSSRIATPLLRKANLLLVLFVNTVATLLIMLVVAWMGVGIFYLKGNFGLMFSNIHNLFGFYYRIGMLFGLAMSIIFNFLSIINTLVGKKVLGKLFIGRYRHPFEVEQVFMFLDIKSSTSIAERIGPKKFMSLVNDFFHDITLPVTLTRGEIYKYVGDEVIITWTMKDALKNANCLRCYAEIERRLTSKREIYQIKYGLVPEFKAGMHGGSVITGELGYTRREIAFMGDVMNTTSRIEEACKKYNAGFLVSEDLMNKLELPEGMAARKVGKEILRGKTEEVALIEVTVSASRKM